MLPPRHPRQDTYVKRNDDLISDRFEATVARVETVLQGIHQHAQNATVYVVNSMPLLPGNQPTSTTDNRKSGHGCWRRCRSRTTTPPM